MSYALADIRVVDLSRVLAGPYCTMLLADYGAEVIKIEQPGSGDPTRAWGPPWVGQPSVGTAQSAYYLTANRNKRSLTLDLKKPGARPVLEALVARSDAVMNNLRGDQPEKLGITYAQLCAVNPAIVCASLSAYGRTGERRTWPGYDYLMQAEAGYLSLTGEPGTPPARFGLSVVDMMSGLFAAFGLLAGVVEARATGRGRDIDVNLFDCALQNLNYLATWQLNHGVNQGREPRSSHPSLTPSQLYPTADGWIFIMCNKEKFWPALCAALGAPELADDPRFARFPDRLKHRTELNALLDERLAARTTAEWLAAFAGVVPAAPVNDVAAALANPFVAEGGRVQAFENASGEPVRMVRAPFSGDFELPGRAAPALGADNAAILRDLGFDAAAIAALVAEGAVAAPADR